MMKTALQGTVPRWWVAIMMTVCSGLLWRMVQQNDEWAKKTEVNTRDIAVVNRDVASVRGMVDRNSEGLGKAVDSIGKIDQIARLLEQRLVRLETREENR